jgi:hypothetical protein
MSAPAGKDSEVAGKCAWDLEPDQIAKEVFRQVSTALAGKVVVRQGDFVVPQGGLPLPIAYHLDDNVVGPPGRRQNESPLLINRPGLWKSRPGTPGDYEVALGQVVFAGTYMKTFTRLTTMEAANESARHAANAVLKAGDASVAAAERRGNLCPFWDPEQNEIQDLDFFKEIDQQLLDMNRPHLVDILGGLDPLPMVSVAGVLDALRGQLDGRVLRDLLGLLGRVRVS